MHALPSKLHVLWLHVPPSMLQPKLLHGALRMPYLLLPEMPLPVLPTVLRVVRLSMPPELLQVQLLLLLLLLQGVLWLLWLLQWPGLLPVL